MAMVRISRNGQVLGEYDEAKVHQLLLLGSLKANDHYWKEGMDAWEPVFSGNWPRSNSPLPGAPPPLPEWYRSSDSCVLGGVCGGLSHKWGRPAFILRILCLFIPLAWVPYSLLWLALKNVPTKSPRS